MRLISQIFVGMCVLFSSTLSAHGLSCLYGNEIYAGAVGLYRSRTHHAAIFRDLATQNTTFDAHAYDFDISPGYEVRAKKKFGHFFIDGRFVKVKEWTDDIDNFEVGNQVSFRSNEFFGPERINTVSSYGSKFWNWEVNIGTQLKKAPIAFNLGYRQGSIKDLLELSFDLESFNVNIDYSLETRNTLQGPQLGIFLVHAPLFWRLYLEGFLKGWFYSNRAHSSIRYVTSPPSNIDTFASGRKNVQGVGINGMLGLRVYLYKSLFISVSYEALLLNKVAQAADQIAATPSTTFGVGTFRTTTDISNKDILYHGVLGGIGISW